ncbi:MAG: peptide deformylase [Candidatus Sungbacteria bacterium]|nr:peptide deformylase [Candidatus Sungbacteria bacterium]
MIREILTEPNPILRKRSREVNPAQVSSREIQDAIQDLKDTLKNSEDGIGIAAPQASISLRIFIISEEAKHLDDERPPADKEWKQHVYINPIITKYARKKVEGIEGCLSVPGKYGVVERPEKVEITAYDDRGKPFIQGASKFHARVLQHELDHLDGVLFVDKVKRFITVPDERGRL